MGPESEAAPADPTEGRKSYPPVATPDRTRAMLGEGV